MFSGLADMQNMMPALKFLSIDMGEIMGNEVMKAVVQNMHPKLIYKRVEYKGIAEIAADNNAFGGFYAKTRKPSLFENRALHKGDSLILDFGNHYVGYFGFKIRALRAPCDAPLKIKLYFAEIPAELGRESENYRGWLSEAWLQEEYVTIEDMPSRFELKRRMAFRYVKIEILSQSNAYDPSLSDFYVNAVSSADDASLKPLHDTACDMWKKIDSIAVRTLHNCMQMVFEDGPKRDRRLWMGDLRLQALTNYETFRSFELPERCLELFVELKEEKCIPAFIYEKPTYAAGEKILMDYSVMFMVALNDYYEYSGNRNFVMKMWNTAQEQLEWAMQHVGGNGIVEKQKGWYCFIDWCDDLEKVAALQGIIIFSLDAGAKLSMQLGFSDKAQKYSAAADEMRRAAYDFLYDKKLRAFKGDVNNNQLSWASQIWMVLAGVLNNDEARRLICDMLKNRDKFIKPVTPYLYHYAVEAMFRCGMREQAEELLLSYWGGMVEKGADTFWEVYSPEDDFFSPYGDCRINSYCHAWSCTPSYFIRKYRLT